MSRVDVRLESTDFRVYDKMSSRMNRIDFSDWLIDELEKREWSQSDLARKANINRQVISTYINKKRAKPDEDVLTAIAHALKLPPETVFRAAGKLPPVIDPDETAEQILYETHDLTAREKEEVLAFIRMKKNLREKNAH